MTVDELLQKYSGVEIALTKLNEDIESLEKLGEELKAFQDEAKKKLEAKISEAEKQFQAEQNSLLIVAAETEEKVKKEAELVSYKLQLLEKKAEVLEQRVMEMTEEVQKTISLIPDYRGEMCSLKEAVNTINKRLETLEEYKVDASYDETAEQQEEEEQTEDECENVEFDDEKMNVNISDDGRLGIHLSDDKKQICLVFESPERSAPFCGEMKKNNWKKDYFKESWRNNLTIENYFFAVSLIDRYDAGTK